MRGGWNLVRRNRNSGTSLRGRGRSNVFSAPRTTRSIAGIAAAERRIVSGHEITFIIEETLRGFMHACTVDDVNQVLAALPPEDWAGIQAIVFRQLTKKERMLSPRWGRIVFGTGNKATVSLTSAQARESILWSAPIVPADATELDHLRKDGHEVNLTSRGPEIISTVGAVRVTQLSRTIPHEVGHWVDYRACAARGDDYSARSLASKEAFAEQYAAKMHARVAAALTKRAA